VFATLRDKLRSGDVWVERSVNYRCFDSYLLPPADVPAIAAKLALPATADEWLARRGAELDRRLRRFARRLRRGELEGVELRDGRLHVASVKAATPPEAEALAARIAAMLPHARITEVMHEVSRATGFVAAFTNLRTGERCDNENALLAAILADATNLGLTRMAAASHGVTRDQLIWTADAYIRPETYKAALARLTWNLFGPDVTLGGRRHGEHCAAGRALAGPCRRASCTRMARHSVGPWSRSAYARRILAGSFRISGVLRSGVDRSVDRRTRSRRSVCA
jgi:hypothetical protein